jgi:large-conductance mechanosensitive channel
MLDNTIPELDKKGLREFGVVTGAIVAGLFGLLLPWLLERPLPVWPWIVFAVLGAWGIIAPTTLRPVYRGWMRFGHFMGRIVTPIIMGLIFYLVITPIATVRKLLGKDSLARKLESEVKSYRVESVKPSVENLKRPF